MNHLFRSVAPISIAAGLVLGLSSCGGGTDGATNRPPDDWLVYRVEAEPNTLHPFHDDGDAFSSAIVNRLVFQSLLDRNNRTLELEPCLAESWEESPDHLTFTFHLRKDVTWHDGEPFTAEDVKFSFGLLKNPEYPSSSLGSYFEDCREVEIVDEYTVRFHYNKSYFLAAEYCGGLPVVPAHTYEGIGDIENPTFNRNPIGTGPYRFVEWKAGHSVTYKRYEDHWGPKPEIEHITFRFIEDQNTALQAFRNGELQMISRLETEAWVSAKESESFTEKFDLHDYDYPTYGYIGWNLRRPLFQDKRVRQALTMLIDRETIAEKFYYGTATVVNGPFFFKLPANDKTIETWPFDPQQAKALLAEAGWRDSDGDGILDKDGSRFAFELLYPSGTELSRRIAATAQDEMGKAGIEMTLANLEWGSLLTRVAENRDFDSVIMGWAMDVTNDPQQLWHSQYADISNSSNHVGFKNDEADRLIDFIRNAKTTNEERLLAYHKFHALLHEEQPYTFLLSRQMHMAVDKRYQDIEFFAPRPCFDVLEWTIAAPRPAP